MPLIQGNVNIHGRIAYVSQQPWVFPGTMRSNILFGKKYEEDRYKEVIKACDLEKVNNDFWATSTQISNSDNVGLNSKVSWNFFLIYAILAKKQVQFDKVKHNFQWIILWMIYFSCNILLVINFRVEA